MERCVILVGHGGVPSDCPPKLVADFKRLEAAAHGRQTPELVAADEKLRRWPRDARTDPYKTGLETIVYALAKRLADRTVLAAYNEFCSPSLEEAFAQAAGAGAREITVASTMYTRGGIHSENDIPAILARLRREHPGIAVRYAWPFDIEAITAFLAAEVARAESAAPAR